MKNFLSSIHLPRYLPAPGYISSVFVVVVILFVVGSGAMSVGSMEYYQSLFLRWGVSSDIHKLLDDSGINIDRGKDFVLVNTGSLRGSINVTEFTGYSKVIVICDTPYKVSDDITCDYEKVGISGNSKERLIPLGKDLDNSMELSIVNTDISGKSWSLFILNLSAD